MCDNAKKMIQGKFIRKTPWTNVAVREIKELKKDFGRKMIKLKAPKKLWDDF